MNEFNCAPYLFRPVWVMGEKMSRIGHVIELGYPCSSVMIPESGIIEVQNKRLNFIHRQTHWPFVAYIYRQLGTDNCCAITRVKP